MSGALGSLDIQGLAQSPILDVEIWVIEYSSYHLRNEHKWIKNAHSILCTSNFVDNTKYLSWTNSAQHDSLPIQFVKKIYKYTFCEWQVFCPQNGLQSAFCSQNSFYTFHAYHKRHFVKKIFMSCIIYSGYKKSAHPC